MNVATIEVIGHHRLALKLLAEMIASGEAQKLQGMGIEAIAASAIAGGILMWEKATPMELAQLITVIREAVGLVEDPDEIPTAADPDPLANPLLDFPA